MAERMAACNVAAAVSSVEIVPAAVMTRGPVAAAEPEERKVLAARTMAGMDDQQRHQCAEMMLERLREQFSDRAVRDTFWRLPQVIDLAPRG